MPCFSPLEAVKSSQGIFFDGRFDGVPIKLPCGRCIGCRLERSRQWAVRAMDEASLHPMNCFLTLTYSDEYLPKNGNLCYRDFQLFMKRLRKFVSPVRIQFLMCGEYGDLNGRAHYHALIFGMDFLDKVPCRTTAANSSIFSSPTLSRLWPFGHSSIGALTFESAAYVARYSMKKLSGGQVLEMPGGRIDLETGQVLPGVPEFLRCSLRPAIGKNWFLRHADDVYAFDRKVVNGVETKPPRYYDKLLKARHAFAWDDISKDREERAFLSLADQTNDRLEARERVVNAQFRKLKRNL